MDGVSCPVKIALTCFAVCVTLFQILSIGVIRNARRTPANFRLLSLGLIVIDGIFIWCIWARVWFASTPMQVFIDRTCFAVGVIQFNTISLMTFERYMLFTDHRRFIKYFHPRNNKRIACLFWISLAALYVMLRMSVCTAVVGEVQENGPCYKYSGQAVATVSFLAVAASVLACIRIFLVIREKKRSMKNHLTAKGEFNPSAVQSYGSKNDERSSYLVFLYTFSSVMGMLGLAAYFVRAHPGTGDTYFLGALGVMLVSAILDACLYVFWFKECRMQLLKMCACCSSKVQRKVDTMRIEIYDIVTATQSGSSSDVKQCNQTRSMA